MEARHVIRPRTFIAVVAATVAVAGLMLTGVAAAGTPPYKITFVNNTGQDPANVYATLLSSGGTPPSPSGLPNGFAMNTAYSLDPIGDSTPWVSEGDNRYSITLNGAWSSGTILYSIGTGYGSKPTAGKNLSPYDFSEITVDDISGSLNGDISSVDQIGVPARLSVLTPGRVQANRDGSTQPATEYVGCVNATWNLLQQYAGSIPQNVFLTSGGQFLQMLGPTAGVAWSNYPSFQQYVTGQAQAGLIVTGNFGGNTQYLTPASTYSYTGSLTADGQWLKLSGTLGNSLGYPNPMDMYVPLSELWTHDDPTWTGASGSGVYRQNGPYVLVLSGGAQPTYGASAFFNTAPNTISPYYPSTGNSGGPLTVPGYGPNAPPAGNYATDANDIYGWMYGDLVASFAMGYWGSSYGSNSVAWNTNALAPYGVQGTPGAAPAPFAAGWANAFPGYPLFNVYQAAVNATGTTYGSPLNDRFTPAAISNPELGVTPPSINNPGPYTWAIELLAQNGCAQALSVSPASGPAAGGQQVTITGRNFHQWATVTIGGIAATNVRVTHNPATTLDTITATTPAAPSGGPANVRVTNVYGSKANNIDTSVLPLAYAYPASGTGSGGSPGRAAGTPIPPGGVSLGGGSYRYPGTGCSLAQVVRGAMQAKSARAPRVTVPAGAIAALAVHGLPKRAEVSVDIQINGNWAFLGRVPSNASGEAVFPRYAQTIIGQSALIRARAGSKGVRYLRTVAGAPRALGGTKLSAVVTRYPLGTCPVHYAAAKKPAAATLGKAPMVVVPLGGITVVQSRGLTHNASIRVDVQIGSVWSFVGRAKADRNGVLAMPPLAIGQQKQVVEVRLRGDGATRYVKLRAS